MVVQIHRMQAMVHRVIQSLSFSYVLIDPVTHSMQNSLLLKHFEISRHFYFNTTVSLLVLARWTLRAF